MHPSHGLPCKNDMEVHAMSTWNYSRLICWSEAYLSQAMLVQHGITGKMSAVSMPAVRDELAATLEETLRLQQRLMDDVRDEGVPVADLAAKCRVPRGVPAGQAPAATGQPRVRAPAPGRAERLGPGTWRP